MNKLNNTSSLFLLITLSLGSVAIAQETTNERFVPPASESLLAGDAFDMELKDFEFFPIPELDEDEFNRLVPPDPTTDDSVDKEDTIEPTFDSGQITFGTPSEANVNQFPYSTGGALLFTQNGRNARCSAQFMADSTVLLTAAHCIRDRQTGSWNTRTVFYRAYKNGTGDFFATQCLATKQGWVSGSNPYKYDYAFIKLIGSSSSGTLGYKSGAPYSSFESIGYPGNFGGGRAMQKVTGTKGAVSNSIVEMRGNPMTFGASGGAWIGAGRYAIGVNSFIRRDRPGNMYGPLFDANVRNLYEYARRGCRN